MKVIGDSALKREDSTTAAAIRKETIVNGKSEDFNLRQEI
jgi:hypothetical protein